MKKIYKKSIFWFRQDLRIYDNRGFIQAVTDSGQVLAIFILDTNIIEKFGGFENQKFFFIREMLENLDTEIKKRGGQGIKIFLGKPENILVELVEKYSIEAIFCNTSYENYGQQRDIYIQKLLPKTGFIHTKDFVLQEPHEVEQRKVFTPFYKLWQKKTFDTWEQNIEKMSSLEIDEGNQARDFIAGERHPYFTLEFGNTRLHKYIKSEYDNFRNDLDLDGTSKLAPYLRFGVFSVRQIYNIAKEESESFVSELAWREFWMHIAYYFPSTKSEAFQEKKRYISRENDKEKFEKWCKGETGYPVIDAAMKQLLETNWMHGRARMIVASFLTKDLLIDWKWGEKFFQKHLLDYDEAVNIGNWQWSASVGADPKPLRIFSPILQSEKFDSEAKFIRKYLPELRDEPLKAIHNPLKYPLNYVPLIVDHSVAQRRAREVYKQSAIDFLSIDTSV